MDTDLVVENMFLEFEIDLDDHFIEVKIGMN